MPSRTLSYAANSAFTDRRRKNGRWMKLCEIVFEFHQMPSAIAGAVGIASNRTPCAAASAVIKASPGDVRMG